MTRPPLKSPRPDPPTGETIHAERRFSIRKVELALRDGTTSTRMLTVHPGAVVILPITADGQIVFIRNHRWQVGEALIELPAGTCDKPDEPLIEAAARELREEAGLHAATLAPLASMYAAPGGSTEVMHLFEASDLTEVGQALEPDEQIEVVPLPIEEARRRLIQGGFIDMKTIAALGIWFARQAASGAADQNA